MKDGHAAAVRPRLEFQPSLAAATAETPTSHGESAPSERGGRSALCAEIPSVYRRVRDAIRARVEELVREEAG